MKHKFKNLIHSVTSHIYVPIKATTRFVTKTRTPNNNQMSNKMRLSLFRLLFILITLSLGCNNARAEEVTFRFSDYQGKGAMYGAEFTMDKGDIKIGDTKFYGDSQFANFREGGITTITPAANATITKIVITASGTSFNGYQDNGAYTPSIGNVSYNKTNNRLVEWNGTATSSFTIEHTKTIRWISIVVTYEKQQVASHIASFSINGIIDERSNKAVAEGEVITFPPVASALGMYFRGWAKHEIIGFRTDSPELVDEKSEIMGSDDIVYYAVFASESTEGNIEKLSQNSELKDGDNIALYIEFKNQYVVMCQAATEPGYIDHAILDDTPSYANLANDSKRYWTLTSAGDGKWFLGDNINGYLYNEEGSDNMSLNSTTGTAFSIRWEGQNGCFEVKNGNRWLSCRSDKTDGNKLKYQGGGISFTPKGNGEFTIYRVTHSNANYYTNLPASSINHSATDGMRYFATFCNSNNVAFPKTLADGSSLSVSAVTVKKGNAEMVDIATSFSCEMDDKVIVPANTGVLLVVKGASATPLVPYYVFLGEAPGNTDDLNATNLLIPCHENGNCPSRAGANLYYKLAYGDYTNKTNLGFWWGNDDGSNAFTVKSGGAVLCVPQSLASNARGFTLDNDDMLTVIGCYIDKDSNGMTYNLSGRRVTREYRGVRIEKGRKCVR